MNKLACNPSGMIRSSHASTARREDDQGKVCILCGKTDIYMSQYGNWGALEKAYIVQHLSETPSDESWICKKHNLEAQRHHSTPNFIPKWKGQRSQKPVTKCLNPKCQTSQFEKLIKPAFAPIDKLKSTIGISTTDPFYAKSVTMIYTSSFIRQQFVVHVELLLRLVQASAVQS